MRTGWRLGARGRKLCWRDVVIPVVVVIAAAALLTLRSRETTPPERITVAVADFANETGDPELDGLSGLLITSLEQSRRLTVLTRSRMLDVLEELGKEDVQRIDEPLAREVGRHAGARALMFASIRRFEDVYTVEMKALDPVADAYLFTLKEQADGKSSIPGVIDRLSERARLASRFAAMRPGPPAWINVSVAHARTGQVGPALPSMQRAVDAGSDAAFRTSRSCESSQGTTPVRRRTTGACSTFRTFDAPRTRGSPRPWRARADDGRGYASSSPPGTPRRKISSRESCT